MAWLYEKSAAWRTIVRITRDSPLAFAAFGITVGVAIPYFATDALIQFTNPEATQPESEHTRALKMRQGHETEMMARINKDRLQLLLDEVQNKNTSEDRYRASLNGQTVGTSTGTSKPQ
mmetsp:Transcript_10132/g.19131  ORF Transcript_10132/g.19131 Transcript_10132/m.19131 type:complete len:119 (+) Transcript_10132:311-667(+)|eukprot:CAMPEP_0114236110 /NCGR_PEP_ID=MMETSP0058-20121206/6645_1 /TAXON_ID=36894 /ORGANISM="Pyramimonas parkeae, CCMP726" /LENGTH=118 /DNA_ID=CAMNT_0001347989 /DNA_START=311 /DNA_END=667 /DNA_ORIENTATION=-